MDAEVAYNMDCCSVGLNRLPSITILTNHIVLLLLLLHADDAFKALPGELYTLITRMHAALALNCNTCLHALSVAWHASAHVLVAHHDTPPDKAACTRRMAGSSRCAQSGEIKPLCTIRRAIK